MKGHVVKVFLDDAEMGELDKARGLVSRSGFIRNKIFPTSRVAEKEDARPPKGRDVGVAGKTSPVRTQPIAGSNPAPATKPTELKPQDDRFCEHGVLKSEHNCRACDLARAPLFKR